NPDLFPQDVLELMAYFHPELESAPSVSMVGSPQTIRAALDAFVARMQPDELIVVAHIYGHRERLRSYEIVAGLPL
ncbi:MAG TPA: hypothetical protein VEL51_02550, partial [Vicinamibacterales bacterium]|nr:hypothetical protein [Vicinamibacterales bacterium]